MATMEAKRTLARSRAAIVALVRQALGAPITVPVPGPSRRGCSKAAQRRQRRLQMLNGAGTGSAGVRRVQSDRGGRFRQHCRGGIRPARRRGCPGGRVLPPHVVQGPCDVGPSGMLQTRFRNWSFPRLPQFSSTSSMAAVNCKKRSAAEPSERASASWQSAIGCEKTSGRRSVLDPRSRFSFPLRWGDD